MAISFDSPVATHRLTYIPTGTQYLLCVIGNEYKWKKSVHDWSRPVFHNFTEYTTGDNWVVEKINKFKGNV